jgi:hypothetical protein
VLLAKYCWDDNIHEDDMDEACGTTGNIRNVYNILVMKPKGKRPRQRWEDNFKTDLKEILLECGLD